MKKIILFSFLMASILSEVNAQGGGCPPPCKDVTPVRKEKIVVLCAFEFIPVAGGQPPTAPPIIHPNAVWYKIEWLERTCNGETYIDIENTTIGSALLNYEYDASTSPPSVYFPNGAPRSQCAGLNGMHPHSMNDEAGWRAFHAYLFNLYKPQGNYNLPGSSSTPGKCEEMVTIAWPAGAGFWQPGADLPNGGGAAPPVFFPLTSTITFVSCGGICCLSTTESPTSTTSGSSNCTSRQRDPNYVPQMGPYTGTITNGFGCQPSCANHTNMASFTTGLNSTSKPLELEANPTQVTDKIYFTTKEIIRQASVFDVTGKKVMELPLNAPELNLTELKSGIYYVQIKFDNKEVRTIKIYKN